MSNWSPVRVFRSEDLIAELHRRLRISEEFLENLCALSRPTALWFVLWRTGRPCRFGEIAALAYYYHIGSKTTVAKYLTLLIEANVVLKLPDGRYVAKGPFNPADSEAKVLHSIGAESAQPIYLSYVKTRTAT